MTQERYERIEHKFWIIDPELGLALEGEFDTSERSYFSSGQLRSESCFKQKVLHGPSIYYEKAGQILSKTWYFDGKKVGKAYRYFITGRVYSFERFIHDLPHLAQEYYHYDGSVKTMIHYDQGILHGETILFWPDGTLKRRCLFSQGTKELDIFYDEGGNLIGDVEQALS